MGPSKLSLLVSLVALVSLKTTDATLGGTYASEWGETIHICGETELFVSYISDTYNGVAELQWSEANSRYEGQFISPNGIGSVWWAENAGNSTILEGEWSFNSGVFGDLNTGTWNGEQSSLETDACDNIHPTDVSGVYDSDWGEVHLCNPGWDLGFTRQVEHSILQGEWIGTNKHLITKFPANGVFFMVWSPTELKYVGRFQSILGGGSVQLDAMTNDNLPSLSFSVDTSGHQFTSADGTVSLQVPDHDGVVNEVVCAVLLPNLNLTFNGDLLSNYDEELKLCSLPFSRDSLGVTLQAEYQAATWNGLSYGIYTFSSQSYIGYFESQNGKGWFEWEDKEDQGFVGLYGFIVGDFFEEASGPWNATKFSNEIYEPVCSDFRHLPKLDGSYTSNFQEEVKICNPTTDATVGVVQVQYIYAGTQTPYNGLAWLMYRPTEGVYKGYWESQNGLGSVVWWSDGDHVSGYFNEYYGYEGGGNWTLTSSDGGVEQAVCDTLWRYVPDLSGEYKSQFGEAVGLCVSDDLLKPLTAEYMGAGESYNGVAMLMYVPTEAQFRGLFVSQNGFGAVTWKHLDAESTSNIELLSARREGTWSFLGGDYEDSQEGSWWLDLGEAELPGYENLCETTFRDTPTLEGKWSLADGAAVLNLCSLTKGYSQGNVTQLSEGSVRIAVSSVYQYTTSQHRIHYTTAMSTEIGFLSQDAENNLSGELEDYRDGSFESDTAEGVDCNTFVQVRVLNDGTSGSGSIVTSTSGQVVLGPSQFVALTVLSMSMFAFLL